MDWFSRIKESPNYERLKHSLEYRHLRKQAILSGSFSAVFILLVALTGLPNSTMGAKSVMAFVMGILVLIPMTLYYVYQMAALFFKIDRWTFSETILDKPHMGSRGSAYFTVTVRDRSGRELQRDTSSLFHSYSEPCFDDCVNKTALIGYNDETDTVAVIQILP